jgi:hypothetical protein
MQGAIATLELAARSLQRAEGLDRSKYGHVMAQLRQVMDKLAAAERRTGNSKAGPVDFTQMLRDAAATASDQEREDILERIPESVFVEGPADDLRQLICSLVQYSRAVRRVDLRAQINHGNGKCGATCTTELAIQPPGEVPDFLRRRMWDAARIRSGEVFVTSTREGYRIGMVLPIERP